MNEIPLSDEYCQPLCEEGFGQQWNNVRAVCSYTNDKGEDLPVGMSAVRYGADMRKVMFEGGIQCVQMSHEDIKDVIA